MNPRERSFPVDIIGQEWMVYVCRPWSDVGAVGDCNTRDRVVRIDATTPKQVRIDSLLHELLHAMLYASGASYGVPEELEERIVYALAPVMLDFMRSNKQLVKDIIRG